METSAGRVSVDSYNREMMHGKTIVLSLGVLLMTLITVSSCATPHDSGPSVGSQVGNRAPGFNLVDLKGKAVSLADFQGKPLLINFWTTWCSPCRREMPYLQEVYEEWSDKGLSMLVINLRESPSTVKEFLSTNGLFLPILLDSTGRVSDNYGIISIPTTFFIDGDGIIRQKAVGTFPSLEAIVEKLHSIMP